MPLGRRAAAALRCTGACAAAGMAGEQPGATLKHPKYHCQLITANSWLQPVFLKGLTTSNCRSIVNRKQHPSFPSVYYLNWVITFIIETFFHIFHVLLSTTSFSTLVLDMWFPTRLNNFLEPQHCTKIIFQFSFWYAKQIEMWQPLIQNTSLHSEVY